jgi:hypothetical protein
MIACVCWRWGGLFGPEYVNRMAAMLRRHLHVPHQLHCITDNAEGIGDDVVLWSMPGQYAHTPRCRRRMQQYAGDFDHHIGDRLLSVDLDMVLVDDITPLVNRPEPIVMWRVGYANVLSGSFVLWSAGALDGAWRAFQRDPEGFPRLAEPRGIGSDQAMLNHWLARRPPIAEWTNADGLVPYFGAGYEQFEHLGVGPGQPHLPDGTRVVVLGSADKHVMDQGRFEWVRQHWLDAA